MPAASHEGPQGFASRGVNEPLDCRPFRDETWRARRSSPPQGAATRGLAVYSIDPSRTDLAEEFRRSPDGPYSPELRLVVNRLRLMPPGDRHVIVCTRRGEEWVVAKMPPKRGAPVEILPGKVYSDYGEAVWEVFRLRWKTVTGQELDP